MGSARDKIILAEVKAIADGRHGSLPTSEPRGSSGYAGKASLNLTNATGYELTVLYAGPDKKRVAIAPGGSARFQLRAGDYQIAARVSASHVNPFYGAQPLGSSYYSEQFYIAEY